MKKGYYLISAVIIFSGCSNWLMPYKEDFSCQLGAGAGYCGSVLENYNRVQKKLETITEGNATFNANIFDKTVDKDILEAMWLKQRSAEKQQRMINE
ncbi:hypothetical protein A9K75_06655 [Campylobacter fetus subsp. testudinum]|uniref:hypothetical protein n=1 Tax=Campylobacter fetus TaxID=196 RepID=UPI000818B20C|nr:hypothetical protein [Campylobacter fetus]OCR99545.1 hypothetical protein A9K75_06655 [Campylobacter fetus subsp. testudinum]